MESPYDKLLRKLQIIVSKESPGLQYQIISQDRINRNFAVGIADIYKNIPVTEATQFAVYSLTKAITAIAIFQLVDMGLLSIEHPVDDYLPEFQISKKVRIKHLLSQSSGLKNPIPARWVHLPEEDEEFSEISFFESIFEKSNELDFEPGEKYQYSNISYWLLALTIEKVVDQKFCDYVDQKIFLPLGLPGDNFKISSQKFYATGYLNRFSFMNVFKHLVTDSKFWAQYEKGWLKIEPCYVNGPGFGGLFANSYMLGILISDLLEKESKILSEVSKQFLFSQQFANDGKPLPMSLGFHIDSLNGIQYFFKEGAGMGFHAEMRVYPSLGVGTVLLTNSGSFNTRRRLTEIDQLLLANYP